MEGYSLEEKARSEEKEMKRRREDEGMEGGSAIERRVTEDLPFADTAALSLCNSDYRQSYSMCSSSSSS
jgi:hypothetical protein